MNLNRSSFRNRRMSTFLFLLIFLYSNTNCSNNNCPRIFLNLYLFLCRSFCHLAVRPRGCPLDGPGGDGPGRGLGARMQRDSQQQVDGSGGCCSDGAWSGCRWGRHPLQRHPPAAVRCQRRVRGAVRCRVVRRRRVGAPPPPPAPPPARPRVGRRAALPATSVPMALALALPAGAVVRRLAAAALPARPRWRGRRRAGPLERPGMSNCNFQFSRLPRGCAAACMEAA